MNEITPLAQTMTSREIAELTLKQHAHVMRDIRTMLSALGKDKSSFGSIFLDTHGRPQPEFRLDRELTLTLVSGYDIPLRHRVVTRLAELEEQARNPIAALSRVDLLKLALDSEEKRLELEKKVEVMQITVAAHDRLSKADGSVCITNAAKDLQVRPKDLFSWLRERQWIYRRSGGSGYLAYQDRIQQGLLEHKVTTVERSDGSAKIVEQVLVTSKGLAKLAVGISAQ